MAKRKRERVRGNRDDTMQQTGLSRREFLAGVAATTGALALGGCGESETQIGNSDPESQPLPSPEASGIEHIVVVMMENRSFDHFLGWVPGADGRQAGLHVHRQAGQGARHLSARAGLPELPARRSRPRLRRRARAIRQRRQRRLAARRDGRSLPDRLLHAGRPVLLRRRRARRGRPSTATSPRSSARRSRTASTCTRRKPTASTTSSSATRYRRSGIGLPTRGSPATTTAATCRSCAVGRALRNRSPRASATS